MIMLAIWWALRREGVMEKDVLAITEVYKYIITLVRINSEKSKNKADIRVHWGSVFSPFVCGSNE